MKINNVVFAGNLTRDPESREVGQNAVVKFTLAWSEKFKTAQGEVREATTFLDVEAWGKTAELCMQYLTKGMEACAIGKLKQENWDDKDGNKRSRIILKADSVQFGARRDGGGDRAQGGDDGGPAQTARPSRPAPAPAPAKGDDEPPF